MKKLSWYVADKDYIKYLKKFDSLVPNIDYGPGKIKPYIGVVLNINDMNYYVPITSEKAKHYSMHETLDLVIIKDTKTNRIFGVMNLNNMLPIPDQYIKRLDYRNISEFRNFNTIAEERSFIAYMSKELSIINKRQFTIHNKATLLYNKKINFPESRLSKRCCDFQLLEEKSLIYKPINKDINKEDEFDY